MPSIPQPHEPLSDGAVAVRLFAERDIPEILIAYQDDPELHLRLGDERPPSGAELGRASEGAAGERAAGSGVRLTIVLPGSDECVGGISVDRIDWTDARAELGIWLAPQVRGRGLAPRALRLTAGWLFQSCGLERLGVLAEPGNEHLTRAAERAGFVHEGILRGYARQRAGRVDRAVMSLLRGDMQG